VQGCPGHDTIAAFVDGALGETDVDSIESHIDGCATCRKHISSLVRSPPPVSFLSGDPAPPEPGEPPLLVPGARIGRFVVLKLIARGGMGTVARAYDPELDRRVALKILRPELWRLAGDELRSQLVREAVMMARLAHPNVVTVFDAGTWGEQVFIAMEYVAGTTLHEWLPDRTWGERLSACLAAAAGLAAAHRAGVIHRDVKPANILCGDDGRVLIGDFGLSALEQESGVVAGTPGYMAPEQMEGRAADERSDQFGFCVSACEALWGDRLFAGTDLDRIRAAIRRPPLPAARPGREARVLAVLRRGLAEAPADRWGSMEELIAALEQAARPRTRARWIAGGAALAAAGVGAALFLIPDREPVCADGGDRLTGVWDRDRRSAVGGAFAGAPDDLARLTATLDRHAGRWVGAYTDACRATHERGEQSDSLLDARMSCLGAQLGELDALVDALVDAGPTPTAVQAAWSLPAPADCSADALRERGRPASFADDPAAQKRAAEVDRLLAEAAAQHRLAMLEPELALLDRAEAAAGALGDPVRQARVLLARGVVEHRLGRIDQARVTLPRAALAAAEARDDRAAAEATAEMLGLVSEAAPQAAEVAVWEQALERELARLPHGAIRARLEIHKGLVALNSGDLAGALGHAEKSVALAEKEHGPDSPLIAAPLRFLGSVHAARGDPPRARRTLERAIRLVETGYGPDHPDVASGLSLMARVAGDGGDPARAVELLTRALAIRERVFGPDHPNVAHTLGNLGAALDLAGDKAGARRAHERSLAMEEKALGRDSWESAPSLSNLGRLLAAQGENAGARAYYQRAVAIYRDKYPPDFADQTVALAGLGHLLRSAGRCREAAPHLARAIAIHRAHGTPPPAALSEDARACDGAAPPRRAARRPR
jgi:tetratricopeptide (TPR) repeat protein/tRNA A-37 threonylcarbamoyl transferase component Bud32